MTRNVPTAAPILLPLGKYVLAVELYDLTANEKIGTFHRDGSRCTFSEIVQHRDFELRFRLDWGDLEDGEPILDLDVNRVEPDGTRKLVQPKRNPQHHTTLSSLKPGSNVPRTYDLEYAGLTMRLVAKKSFAIGAGLSIYIVDPDHKPEAEQEEAIPITGTSN